MFEKINNWHLSIMIMIVSIVSLALIQNHVLAQWADPNVSPEEGTNQVFFNPAVGALDLNNYNIIDNSEASFILDPGGLYGFRVSGTDFAGWFDGNVNIVGTLTIDGREIEGGADRFIDLLDTPVDYVGMKEKFIMVNTEETGLVFVDFVGPKGLWSDVGADIYRDSNVAIGFTDPDVLLDIKSELTHDATIDIQSGDNSFWRIYNEETSNDLRFNASGTADVLTLKNTGEVLVNTTTIQADLTVDGTAYFSGSDAKTLSVYNTLSSGKAIYGEGFNAIKGYSNLTNGIGVYGQSALGNGIKGIGATGVYGISNGVGANSYGVQGHAGSGRYGGFFEGTSNQGAGAMGVTSSGIAGVWGEGTESTNVGVRGNGYYGVAGFVNTASGAGIYGVGSTTADAAQFEGDVVIAPLGGADSFLKLDTISSGTPSAGDCTASEKGRMIVDTGANKLWVCSDVWRSTILF